MDTRIGRSLRILIAGLVVSAGAALAAVADDATTINQRLAAMGLNVCAVTPTGTGAYHVQVRRSVPGSAPAGAPKPGPCPFSIGARFEGGVLILDKEGLGRAGLVFPLLPPGVKIASFPSGLQPLQGTHAMLPTDLNTMQHSLDHAKAMRAEALAKLDALKMTAAQADAILGSCPAADLGTTQPSLPIFDLNPHTEKMEALLDPGSCDSYVENVTTQEENCSQHLDSIKSGLNEADEIAKYAVARCANGGLSSSDRQSLKSSLGSLQVQATDDATRIDALISHIQQLIEQYRSCVTSKPVGTAQSSSKPL